MPHEQITKPNRIEKAVKSFHRRMSSFGKSPKPFISPYYTLPTISNHETLPEASSPASSAPAFSPTHAQNLYERDTRLFSLDKLLNGNKVSEKDRQWFDKINMAVRQLTNSPEYNTNHDYEHIQRVVNNARRIWLAEKHRDEFSHVDRLVIFVAAMVHNIGDTEDFANGVHVHAAEADQEMQDCQRDTIEAFIRQSAPECPPYIWGPASHVASLVSFSRERRNPLLVVQQCAAYPALQVVQDAVRLDELGALGVVRAAGHGGAGEARGTGTVRKVVQVADERFSQVPDMMKTHAGRHEAARQWEIMENIMGQMLEQASCDDVLEEY